jgi:hypothetical protein
MELCIDCSYFEALACIWQRVNDLPIHSQVFRDRRIELANGKLFEACKARSEAVIRGLVESGVASVKAVNAVNSITLNIIHYSHMYFIGR